MTSSKSIAAYEQMTAAIRQRLADANDVVPANISVDILLILAATENAVQREPLAETEPAAAAPAVASKSDVQILARWLWNRGFGSGHLPAFGSAHRMRLMEASGVPGTAETWTAASTLVAKVEARLEKEPNLAAGRQENLDEHEQWLPAAAVEAPPAEAAGPAADPFKNSPRAEANRKAKAKTLARWLWDRSIDAEMLQGFTPKYRRVIARAAGINPPSTMDTWDVALGMIAKMEARAIANPDDPVTLRHFLTENEQWSVDPHAVKAA